MNDVDTAAMRDRARGQWWSHYMFEVCDALDAAKAEIDRLKAEAERGKKTDRLEIRHGWLVENDYEPDRIAGYGYLLDTNVVPLLQLSMIPGWPEETDGPNVRRDAWDEGFEAGTEYSSRYTNGNNGPSDPPENPYRAPDKGR